MLISLWRMRNRGFLAWPNISAGRFIVPERIGRIIPEQIANEASEWLASPYRLLGQKNDLKSLRGEPGAITKLSQEIVKLIPLNNINNVN